MSPIVFDVGILLQLMVYVASIAVVYGRLSIQITQLTKTVEKHNQLIERTYKLEESVKSAHHRIDELREDFNG